MNIHQIEQNFQPSSDGKCAVAQNGMVATAFPPATKAGVEMLSKSGNAVDAACAAAFALGVCEPQASGLGGQTMGILHFNGQTIALDGSGCVPFLAHPNRIETGDLQTGYRATTVPSTPAVLGRLHAEYGCLPWSTILEPAIRIARNGYPITRLQHQLQRREIQNFNRVPSRSGAEYFLKDGKQPYAVGECFRQTDLADLLELMAEKGVTAFYSGKVADMIDADMCANKGFLRAADLARIPWPVKRAALQVSYRGLTVLTTPPPTPGRILLLILRVLDLLPQGYLQLSSPSGARTFAALIRKALAIRIQDPIHPDRYDPDEDPIFKGKGYVRGIADAIMATSADNPEVLAGCFSGGETTHLSVMDAHGNAIGLTQSINQVYGSKAAARGLGFIYNDYLSDIETSDPTHPHFLKPGGLPWSSVSPTIVLCEGRPWIVTGSPGSERILSTIAQFLFHIIDADLPMCEAMKRPRLHCSTDGTVSLEADRFDPSVPAFLVESGFKINRCEPYAFYHGAIHAVLKRQSCTGFQGVAEIRRDGIAGGYSD